MYNHNKLCCRLKQWVDMQPLFHHTLPQMLVLSWSANIIEKQTFISGAYISARSISAQSGAVLSNNPPLYMINR